MKSALYDRNRGDILIFHGRHGVVTSENLTRLAQFYRDNGYTVDVRDINSSDALTIGKYKLIYVYLAEDDPYFFGQLQQWGGRIVLVGEWLHPNNPIFAAAADWINSKSPMHGMQIAPAIVSINPTKVMDDVGDYPGLPGAVFDHPLTQGMSVLYRDAVAQVIGGQAIAPIVENPSLALLCSHRVGTIEWIVAGDGNIWTYGDPYIPPNDQFFLNLIDVPI